MNIYQKLIEVRKVVPYLQKENAGGQYNYVSSSQVLSNCIEKMNELGLLLIPNILGHKLNESAIEILDSKGHTTKRTTTYFTELDIEYVWVNAENPEETIKTKWYGQGVDIAGEKGVGKALTYAEKYFLLKSFNIATDKDDLDAFQDKDKDKPKKPDEPKKPDAPDPKKDIKKEIGKMLMELSSGDKDKASELLLEFTTFTGKDGNVVVGKNSIKDLSENALPTTYGKIKAEYLKMNKKEGNAA